MSEMEQYAIWYSTSENRTAIMDNWAEEEQGCRFERDFRLQDRWIDYDHMIILWYGEEQGQLGDVQRSNNPALAEGFDFITQPAAKLLSERGIDRISCLVALPDFHYDGQAAGSDTLCFAGHVSCTRPVSDWLREILDDM
ncbi:hypothetical protein [Paenibacillus bovis]|uniref:Uncharacterized protein n=1 Tax=Paenibacillus bovis TaxID=1616788 RepID=A0A172ZCF7_9BACL|nr:hypothetical protein [Paenibacillus bovis]ANF95335.1 hypothetical protein AR543_04420 [Paenibacillus bovis]